MGNPITGFFRGWFAGISRDPIIIILTLMLAVLAGFNALPQDMRAGLVAPLRVALNSPAAPKADPAPPKAPEKTEKAEPAKRPAAAPSTRVRGQATVVDTGTVIIQGKTIRLAHVDPVRHPGAEAGFKFYLDKAGPLACEGGPAGFACTVVNKEVDLAEILALSGIVKILPTAPAHLRKAEAEARRNKAGIWGLK